MPFRLKIFSFFFLLLIAYCLLPVISFSQSITFEKYYDTLDCVGGNCVQQTYDRGYIVAGVNSVSSFNNNVALLKTDSVGNVKWVKSYGGLNNDGGTFIEQTSDSGFIVVADKDLISATDSKIWLLKTDKQGDTLWTKEIIAGVGDNRPYCVQQTTDGGYIICGYTSAKGAGSYDVLLVKTNSSGDTLWIKTYGSLYSDIGYSVQQTSDGGYIVTGTKAYNISEGDLFLIKTNSFGDTLWTKNFRGNYNQTVGFSVQQTTDGGYIIAGIISIPPTNYVVSYLIKTNSTGDTLWTKKYFESGSNNANSVRQTKDGGYIVIINGGAGIGAGIIRTNNSGDTLWTKSYGESHATSYYGTITSDGGCIVTGQYDKFGPNSIYLLKTDSIGFAITGINEITSQSKSLFIYPNPFSFSATLIIPEEERNTDLHYEIYDAIGNKLSVNHISKGAEKIIIQRENLAQGIYFLRLFSNNFFAFTKIIIQ